MVYHPESNDRYFDLILRFKKVLIKGGSNRMKFTIPALIFAVIKLSQTIQYREINPPHYEEEARADEDDLQPSVQVNQKRIYKLIQELLT